MNYSKIINEQIEVLKEKQENINDLSWKCEISKLIIELVRTAQHLPHRS